MYLIKRIKDLIKENRLLHKKNFNQSKELEWAHIYHDSIKGIEWLEYLPLNIGRWAGNYSFFYVLNRLLKDYKPLNILEFGLGESSKFVSTYLENTLYKSSHLIIEQDRKWHEDFIKSFQLSERSIVKICPLMLKEVKGCAVNSYSKIEEVVNEKFDLYLVDGPFGSKNYSRYDIVELAKDFNKKDEFIIIIDDYHREGEKETVIELLDLFKKKNISIYKGVYTGNKSVYVIGTEKYKKVQSL